jgi:hypothetical protein
MGNEVQIIIKAIDKASAEFKKVGGASGALRESFKTLGMAIGGVTAVAGAATVAYKAVIAPIINYNKSILDAARSTRMGTEDLSRFIQVGDDMGVSMDSITRALQMATKNGFAPSISAIAELADKANAMNTPTERAATLAKMFGRNWAELDPILQLGGERIRELAASQADGLVVTEEEIRKTEDLRLKVDALTDTFTAYRNEIALQAVEVIDLNVRATMLTGTWAAQRLALTGQKPTLIEYLRQWHLIEEAMRSAEGVTETGIVKLGHMKAAMDAIRSKDVTVTVTTLEIGGYGSDYRPVGGGGQAGGYAGYVTGGTGGGGARYGPRVEGAGGKFYKMDYQTGQYVPARYGLDMVVPPGYNENFGVRASSGEHIQVTPAGEKPKSGANVQINVTSSPMDTQYMVKVIKAAVGM